MWLPQACWAENDGQLHDRAGVVKTHQAGLMQDCLRGPNPGRLTAWRNDSAVNVQQSVVRILPQIAVVSEL